MENLGKQMGATVGSLTNRVQEMEERSGVEDTIAEIDSSVKENVKYNKFLTPNIHKIWDTMKRPNLSIIDRRRTQTQRHRKYIQQNHRRKLKKDIPMKEREP